jgi:UDP-glucose 4-epimerase
MISVVITGASGFLGRAVVKSLSDIGFRVVAVSRQGGQGLWKVNDYTETPVGDILIHLAEEPDRVKFNNLTERHFAESSNTVRFLSTRFKKIIYASSGLVYGDQGKAPFAVNMPVFPTDNYNKIKLINEQIILDAGGTVVRLSNLFGEGMASNNVVSDIKRQVPGRGKLIVKDCNPVRDFLHVMDAASAFARLATSLFTGIVNVGSGHGTSVRALAELILLVAGQTEREIIASSPSFRHSMNVLDVMDTMRILDWAPRLQLAEWVSVCFKNKAQP